MKLNINGQKAEWLETHLTVYGSEGIYKLEVEFADDPNVGASWDELSKKAVYKNSALEDTYPDGIYADIVNGEAEVPAAILSAPGLLYVGVMGEASNIAMPTVWASPLAISPGCGEGQDAPPVVYDAARNAIKYGENAEVYAEGGYLVLEVEGTLDDPVLVRSDEHTDGAKDYADAAALSSNFASARAKDAEAYAIGSRDGEPVTSDDPAYHNNALYYAGQAANSASDAHADAVAAHDDAVNAHADAQAAAGSASDASGYATAAGNAKTAAQSAQGYAEAAQTGAETAEGNAEAWSVGQRDGVDVPATDPAYNNNAKYYAGQAAASAAQAAQTAASIAADFAYLTAPDGISQVGLYQDRDATPGAIVTFADGAAVPAKSAAIAIEPVQDLHGQANPWPAGGGKNKLGVVEGSATIGDVTFTVDANGVITASGTASETVVYTFATSIKLAAGSYLYNGITGGSNDTFCMRIYGDDGNQIGSDLFSGDLAFTLAADATNMFCRIIVRTGQSASGLVFKPMIRLATETDATFAPYSNICPITGRGGVWLHQYGLPEGYTEADYLRLQGTEIAVPASPLAGNDVIITCYFRYSGRNNYAGVYRQYINESTKCVRLIQTADPNNITFYINNNSQASSPVMVSASQNAWHQLQSGHSYVWIDGTLISAGGESGAENTATAINIGNSAATVTIDYRRLDISKGTDTFRSFIPCTDPNGVPGLYEIVTGVFYAPGDATKATAVGTPAEPVARLGKIGKIPFVDGGGDPVTCYGGTLEYPGGQKWRLVITTAEVDLGALDYTYSSGTETFVASSLPGLFVPPSGQAYNVISSAYKNHGYLASWDDLLNGEFGLISGVLRLKNTAYSDAATFKAAMSGEQLVYELATPAVYDLTADEFKTALGDNTIWAGIADITASEQLPISAFVYRTSENSRTIVLGTSLSGVLEAIAGFIGVSE